MAKEDDMTWLGLADRCHRTGMRDRGGLAPRFYATAGQKGPTTCAILFLGEWLAAAHWICWTKTVPRLHFRVVVLPLTGPAAKAMPRSRAVGPTRFRISSLRDRAIPAPTFRATAFPHNHSALPSRSRNPIARGRYICANL
uniref:Uncharacterized protein n=1 Tax=Oryza glumipatula TaxID=40148 RepID=A0A0E0AQR6_9ORYZ